MRAILTWILEAAVLVGMFAVIFSWLYIAAGVIN